MVETYRLLAALLAAVLAVGAASAQGIPSMQQIEDQHILCDEQFSQVNLRSLVSDPDHNPSEMQFQYYDNLDFKVTIEDGVATIHNPGISRKEFIGFRAIDPDGNMASSKATFSSTGCYEQNKKEKVLPPPKHPKPKPHFPGIPFIPDKFFTKPPHTCAISTGHGLLPDIDCDKVPDFDDNCPDVPNPAQRDQNRNGLGDACDLVIKGLEAQPGSLSCGNAVMATAMVVNNHPIPLEMVRVEASIPGTGGKEGVREQFMKVIEPGEAKEIELTTRIPLQAEPGHYKLSLKASYSIPKANIKDQTKATSNIEVDGAACSQGEKNTTMELLEIQDAKPGEPAIYTIKITNEDDRANSYHFAVQGLEGFATYSMNPGSMVILEAGETREVELYAWPEPEAEGGKTFVLEARQGQDVEQITLTINSLPGNNGSENYLSFLIGGLLLAALFGATHAFLNRDSDNKIALGTRGEQRSIAPKLPQKSLKEFDAKEKGRQKVAKVGLEKERGWLYYVDGEGDVSRSRMKWAKG